MSYGSVIDNLGETICCQQSRHSDSPSPSGYKQTHRISSRCSSIYIPNVYSPDDTQKLEISSRLANIEGQLESLLSGNAKTPLLNSLDANTPLNILPPVLATLSSADMFVWAPTPTPTPSIPSHTGQDVPSNSSITPPSSLPSTISAVPDVVMSDATPARVESTKMLVLGNGTLLYFSSSDVPDSPALSFAHDIAKLGRVWDDSRPEFSPSECTLMIKGHHCPQALACCLQLLA